MTEPSREKHLPHASSVMYARHDDPRQSEERATLEVRMTKRLIVAYFNVTRKTMNDLVPKTIMGFLINKAKNQAQRYLVQKVYKDGSTLDDILIEDEATRKVRT